ncbi:MAG TPA: response regulator [Phycisphaerales bacterium]|nr:response regulator [Phycisphaerales bacterium]HCD34235.1 response regulator [Phycisphaerales bacterium]|tara:strand:- start:388 stop:798 length:411 start_codon:yes stop_codon:yes gene_type:complete
MKILIAEDDFVSRKVLLGHLAQYGNCDVAIDGLEAVEAIGIALKAQTPYDLVFLDIMMPNMDGQEALTHIRQIELDHGIATGDGAKVVMSTALSDTHNVLKAFNGQCEAYIVKPVTREKILNQLIDLELISRDVAS